jgi:hypothetical protein
MFKTLVKTMTVVLALSVSMNAVAWDEMTEGKMQGHALMSAMDMQKEAAGLLKEIISIEDQVGMSVEESGGLIKALGEKETMATEAKQKIDAIVQILDQSSNTDEILVGFTDVRTLTEQIRELAKEARGLAK